MEWIHPDSGSGDDTGFVEHGNETMVPQKVLVRLVTITFSREVLLKRVSCSAIATQNDVIAHQFCALTSRCTSCWPSQH